VGGEVDFGSTGDTGTTGTPGEEEEHGLKGASHKPLLPTIYKT